MLPSVPDVFSFKINEVRGSGFQGLQPFTRGILIMSKPKLNQMEKLAREYVRCCADVPESLRAVSTAARGWTDEKCKKHFERLYEKDAMFWRYVAKYQKEVEKHVAMEAADVLKFWENIAQADVSELSRVETIKLSCVACYGPKLFAQVAPRPDCENCGGVGMDTQTVVTPDSNTYSANAKLIFDGAEYTKYGIKVKHLDRMKALELIAKAKGMFVEQLQIVDKTPPELPPLPDDPNESSRIYAEWIKGT